MNKGKTAIKVDLTDLDLFENELIEDVFTNLREDAPVYWNELADGRGFWVLSKYKDISDAWKNTEKLTAEKGNMLRLFGVGDPAGGNMMVVTDPPKHTALRNLHNKSFNPLLSQELEEDIHAFVVKSLDRIKLNKTFDFVEEIAAILPISVTLSMLKVPRSDWMHVADLCRSSLSAEDPEYYKGRNLEETLLRVNSEIYVYLLQLVQERRNNLQNDFLSRMIKGTVNNQSLDDHALTLNLFSFIVAGLETTKYAAAGGLLAFVENPDALVELRNDYSLIDNAIEEILRWTSPNVHVMRIAKENFFIGETLIKKGDTVTLWVSSANRDMEYFDNPFEFDIKRKPNKHITFGVGNHYCLGAKLARIELKILFIEILKRGYKIKITGNKRRLRSNFLAGYKTLPVEFSL
ncbi:cytochrome P450 (plasmid) [Bacillus sp. ZJS3]|uniref:cytochrome P450 n=1 Tax=Bacillus sp. ZJS3 TaxID=2928154 RepID=UPI001FB1CD51|nr:cytochrome P450 [Bacillus sp. ZJS3]UOB81924.1 cytochrome P450 [Bacillus sp. ZJS3]